jgi:hypothetical protein
MLQHQDLRDDQRKHGQHGESRPGGGVEPAFPVHFPSEQAGCLQRQKEPQNVQAILAT